MIIQASCNFSKGEAEPLGKMEWLSLMGIRIGWHKAGTKDSVEQNPGSWKFWPVEEGRQSGTWDVVVMPGRRVSRTRFFRSYSSRNNLYTLLSGNTRVSTWCPFLRQVGWFLGAQDEELERLGYEERVLPTNYILKIVMIVSGWLIPKLGSLF